MINRLIDSPLSLDKFTMCLLMRSHKSPDYSFSRAEYQNKTDGELLKFFKNYFEYGLPIFDIDTKSYDNQIIYAQNPVDWINNFSDKQIEINLTYLYFKKYVEFHFFSLAPNNKNLEAIMQMIINAYNDNDYLKFKEEIHFKIIQIEKQLKANIKDHPIRYTVKFDYRFAEYAESNDLNKLFIICYNLFLTGVEPLEVENIYSSKKISELISD